MELVQPIKDVKWSDDEVQTILRWVQDVKDDEPNRHAVGESNPQEFMHESYIQIQVVEHLISNTPAEAEEMKSLIDLRWMLLDFFLDQADEHLPRELWDQGYFNCENDSEEADDE